ATTWKTLDPLQILRYFYGDLLEKSTVARNRFHYYSMIGTTIVLTALLWDCFAQEFDTVVSSRNRKAYTILDQVQEPAARLSLTALFGQRDAKEKAAQAEAFLDAFPRS